MVRFGPAGNGSDFYNSGNKHSWQMPQYLHEKGLTAYEYSCSRGVNIKQEGARKLGAQAMQYGIALSIHAPYYINLATDDEDKREKSLGYILSSMIAAEQMGASRIVVHSGGAGKIPREVALHNAKITLRMAIDRAKSHGLYHIHICPETMGKLGQLGTLEEVLQLCLVDDSLIPTIDFGHLNARSHGQLGREGGYVQIFDAIENTLGYDRLAVFHSHFSHIEYTAGGEKRHLTFEDTTFGPDFEPIAELVYQKGLSPTFICESADTMTPDAQTMQRIYTNLATQKITP